METSIFVTDLAQQFSLSVVGPSHPVVVPLRVARAGRRGFSSRTGRQRIRLQGALRFEYGDLVTATCDVPYRQQSRRFVTKPSYVLDTEQRSAHHFRQWAV